MFCKKVGNIERFDKEYFESVLPKNTKTGEPLWQYEGIIYGEHCYTVKFTMDEGEDRRIFIRSSIDVTGVSAKTSKDSIRLFLVHKDNFKRVYNKKFSMWTNRRPNWQKRLFEKMGELKSYAKKAGKCKCGQYLTFGETKGQMWAGCFSCNNWYNKRVRE